MRTAFASLVIAAGLVTAAQAQPTAPATEPAAPAVSAPPTEAAAPPAQAPAATPAPEAQPAPPEEAPTLPTTGDGAVLLQVIEKICVPVVRGGDLDQLAKSYPGMKMNRRDGTWTAPLGGDRAYTITVYAVGSNRDVCRGEIHYALNQTDPIVKAVNTWAFLHQPELILQANYVKVYDDGVKRVQRSWEHFDAQASTAVNFTTLTKPDDTALNGKYSTAEFYYQERKF